MADAARRAPRENADRYEQLRPTYQTGDCFDVHRMPGEDETGGGSAEWREPARE